MILLIWISVVYFMCVNYFMCLIHESFVNILIYFYLLCSSILDVYYSKNGSATALIWGESPQRRSDRRKDRVETNPEQLAAASAQDDISFGVSYSIAIISWLEKKNENSAFSSLLIWKLKMCKGVFGC
ncbi:hypothetical protein MKX01_019427 [Papaver californicum]|nr:hypothetical protein MKX01_019427 [Papaver californicum]